jgi:hypothetical protein
MTSSKVSCEQTAEVPLERDKKRAYFGWFLPFDSNKSLPRTSVIEGPRHNSRIRSIFANGIGGANRAFMYDAIADENHSRPVPKEPAQNLHLIRMLDL